jgi:HTH-type transcriptional regulator/antitoxin HigA
MATWNKIASPKEYQTALQRVDELIDVEHTEATHNELMLLSFLIEAYEDDQYPIQDASPLRVLKFMMKMKDIKQKDLIPILGSKGNVSKILNGKASLQLVDIYPLSTFLGIPVEALIPTPENQYADSSFVSKVAEPARRYKKK